MDLSLGFVSVPSAHNPQPAATSEARSLNKRMVMTGLPYWGP